MQFILPKLKLDIDIEDASWAYYSKNFLIRKIYLMRLKKALKLINKNHAQRTLDVGTGCGILIPSLAAHSKVYALDYNEKYLEKAKKLCNNYNIDAELSKIDINKEFPYNNDYFDIIVSLSVLEHVKDLDNALKEINRVLKKDGTLIIGVPIERFLVKLFFKQQKIDKEVESIHIQDYKNIENTISKHFNIEKIEKIPYRFIPDVFSIYKIFKCVKK